MNSYSGVSKSRVACIEHQAIYNTHPPLTAQDADDFARWLAELGKREYNLRLVVTAMWDGDFETMHVEPRTVAEVVRRLSVEIDT